MANEFRHKDIGGVLSEAEYDAIDAHEFASQATGDTMYASSSTQLTRLGIGSTGAVLTVVAGVPSWQDLGGRAHTFTVDQTWNDGVAITLGTGGDVDIEYNGTHLLINTRVVGTGNVVFGKGEGGTALATGITLRAPDLIAGGAGNIAGADLTIIPGLGTGTGDVGQTIFQTTRVASSGDNIQTLTTLAVLDGKFLAIQDNQLLSVGNDHDGVLVLDTAGRSANAEIDDIILGTSTHPGFSANTLVIANTASDGDAIMLVSDAGNSFAYLWADASSGRLYLYSKVGDLQIDSNSETNFTFAGNNYHAFNVRGLTIGGLASAGAGVPAGASNFLELNNGTRPTTLNANAAGLYAKDISSSSEVFAIGEDASESQISPHPGDYLATLPLPGNADSLYNFPWAEHHSNQFLGLEMWVDMAGVVEWAEGQAGRSFHQIRRFTPPVTWAQAESAKASRWGEHRVEAIADGESDPGPYDPMPVPAWMATRGVAS